MSTPTNKKALQLLFERPFEPVFTIRDNGNAVLDVPDSFLEPKYEEVKENISNRFGERVDVKIPLRELTRKPDLGFIQPLKKRQQFSLFNSQHQYIAGELVKLFMQQPDEDQFLSLCAYCKDRVNPFLFQYCYSVAVQHRPDTQNFPVKPIAEEFPHNFVNPESFPDARAEGEIVQDTDRRRFIEIPQNYTASDREEEQRLSYFREDIGVNSHHWHWHLVYPGTGGEQIVRKDRRGELFYYMHHQILARYNLERFCNRLKKVRPLNNLRDPIPEGYFPKLLASIKNRTYPARAVNEKLRDVDRDGNKLEIADLERWADRIVQAIDQGFVTDSQGHNIPLDPEHGIDILGDLVEATELSVNRTLYGNLHNDGHNAISFAHDPELRFLEDFGVMGDVTTAMRDPVFYRWHGYIDTIFNRHKSRLAPYSDNDLGFNGINIQHSEVRITAAEANKPNLLATYWERSEVDLNAGLDFGPNGSVYATFIHLQHAPFEYNVHVNNASGGHKRGTCRIFLCPKTDELNMPLKLEEQRLMAVEMDKFTVELNPGMNVISRDSANSSVTIPYERSFRKVGLQDQPKDGASLEEFRFCGCGWPDHMLLPKGSAEGMTFDLFVMISDFEADKVIEVSDIMTSRCNDSYSFCGLKNKKYPDRRSMGYPFDRRLPTERLEQLVERYPNMKKTDITIKFRNAIANRQASKKVLPKDL